MKQVFLFIGLFIFLTTNCLTAQQKIAREKVVEKYDRASLTIFVANVSNDSYSGTIAGLADNIKLDDKFFNNNLSSKILNVKYRRIDPSQQTATIVSSDKTKEIRQQLNEMKIGKQIIELWYQRQNDGTMSVNLFQERGLYNASDADVFKASSTKLGLNKLKDYGENLIEKSYVLVLDFTDTKRNVAEKTNNVSFTSTVKGYLYKLKFTEDDMVILYENYWIFDDDSESVKAKKRADFNKINYQLEPVTNVTVWASASESVYRKKSDQQLLKEMAQRGYDKALYRLAQKVEGLRVKVPISNIEPIVAKIGKKENLQCDHRYYAYEYVLNSKTQQSEPVRRGIVRATNRIVDNRHVATGESGKSEFYQVSGRKLEPGFLLQQRNDFGIGLYTGYELGSITGFNARLDIRTGRYTGVPGLSLYGAIGIGGQTINEFKYWKVDQGDDKYFEFTRFDFGLSKGFSFYRNFEAQIYGGYGIETAKDTSITIGTDPETDKPKKLTISSGYIKFGTNLALNLYGDFVQLFGGIGYYYYVSEASYGEDEKLKDNSDFTYNKLFKNRGFAGIVGVRFQF